MTILQVRELPIQPHRAVFLMARAGHAAKGAVYLIVGILALRFVMGDPQGELTDGKGAVNAVAGESPGDFLLWITALGLSCYAAWGVVRAVFDPERKGGGGAGAVRRAGYAVSAISHGGLSGYAFRLANGGLREGDTAPHLVGEVFGLPLGRAWVAGAGAIVIGFGLYQLVRACREPFEHRFADRLRAGRSRALAVWMARVGTFARGVVFPLAGFSLIVAAVRRRPEEAHGIGTALRDLAFEPYGSWLLGLIGAGLFAYGFYQIMVARFATIPAPH